MEKQRLVEVKCIVKERTAKNGVKFMSYSTPLKDGKNWANLSFVKEIEPPKKSCLLLVPYDKLNKAKDEGKYLRFWVNEIAEVKELPHEEVNLDDFFEVI